MPVLRVLAAQKKSANHGAHASGLPQKSRNEFCGIISGLPQKSRSEFCGKRRCRRKRKQLEQTQAVSKCALRRRGGDNRTPPKPLKGSPRRSFGFYLFLADASLLRSFEALLQAYIPCIQPSREPTADSGFSLISAFFGGCRFSSLPHKKRAPTMALMLQGSRKNREASFAGREDAGAKENSLSKLKLFQNAPCGDVVGTTGLEPVTSRM